MYILIVEDHDALAANISDYLTQQGDIPDFAACGETALALSNQHAYDAVILDLNLPGIDGIDVCSRLRGHSVHVPPILMLTARDTTEDRICGLESGADDYLTKPFSLRELYLRLQTIVRRGAAQQQRLCIGDLCMQPTLRLVQRAGETLELSPTSFHILKLLMEAFPGVVTRSQIEHVIWQDEPPESEAALRGHIHRLRRVLATTRAPDPIKTMHGVGYQLCTHD